MSLHLSDMVAAKTSLSQASDAICDSPTGLSSNECPRDLGRVALPAQETKGGFKKKENYRYPPGN